MYTVEFYSSIKKNEIILFVGKWMEMAIIMLNKISQTLKDNIACFLRQILHGI
jgi:hypothetical protein